ncbi:hypothetical protein BASA81_015843 [Batrachochytrium salamandrivorans]|nr:hypothetical protein BASA81_015843 [Batrachochytrium salamandrivorans]
MLTDLRWRVCLGPQTISPKAVQPSSSSSTTTAPALKRFRAYSPPPLPSHIKKLATPPPPRTLEDEPHLTASHNNVLLVRAITCSTTVASGEEEEGGDFAGNLVFEYGQEIQIAIITKNWCWGSYVDDKGVEHSGVVPKYCVEHLPVTSKATVTATEEAEEDYLKELESCIDDGFRL